MLERLRIDTRGLFVIEAVHGQSTKEVAENHGY